MVKRDIFAELMEGFDALEETRKGKLTLRKTEVEGKPSSEITPERFDQAESCYPTGVSRPFP